MEKILRKLFDYQKFENNSKLSEMLKEAESSGMQKLSDDELSMVAGGQGKNQTTSGFPGTVPEIVNPKP